MQHTVPVLKNAEWRYLLRDFVGAHRQMRAIPNRVLQTVLLPVASVAWWLAKFAPEVVEDAGRRGSLDVLLPGASIEALDGGRWLTFLPWMLGLSGVETRVHVVGNELGLDPGGGGFSTHLSMHQLEEVLKTPAASVVRGVPPAKIFNGLLRQWREGVGREVKVDACVVFAPGLTQHHDTWMTENDLLPILRDGTPLGFFGYSVMDCLEDQEVLRMCDIQFADTGPVDNPWCLGHEYSNIVGAVASMAWRCEVSSVPDVVRINQKALKDFDSLMTHTREDYLESGGEAVLERLGQRLAVGRNDRPEESDAIIVLPYSIGILESNRALGKLDEEGFTAFVPPIIVPSSVFDTRPDESEVMKRVLWAMRTHRDWAGPAMASNLGSDRPLVSMTEDELTDGLGAFLKNVMGMDVEPDDFLRDLRLQGGAHGPSHPRWYGLFDSMGWRAAEWEENPGRFGSAFVLPSTHRKMSLPAVCEAYMYVPGDTEDELANEAMAVVARRYPSGAVLLFNSIILQEVEGNCYQFGGMLWWQGKWTAFALTTQMKDIDDVLDQVEGGFSLGDDDDRYCDDDHSLMERLMPMPQW